MGKYAVAFSGSKVTDGSQTIFLMEVEAENFAEAIGRFILDNHNPNYLYGAFKAIKLSDQQPAGEG